MTNTKLLRERINDSGYRIRYIASRLGLSYQGFQNKVNNVSEFKATEIKELCDLLKIDALEKEQIFFAPEVDKMPTPEAV